MTREQTAQHIASCIRTYLAGSWGVLSEGEKCAAALAAEDPVCIARQGGAIWCATRIGPEWLEALRVEAWAEYLSDAEYVELAELRRSHLESPD